MKIRPNGMNNLILTIYIFTDWIETNTRNLQISTVSEKI